MPMRYISAVYVVCIPPFCWERGGRGGGLNLQPNFQRDGRGLTGPELLEGGVAGREGVTFFRGGCNFHIKNKLKCEIFVVDDKFLL